MTHTNTSSFAVRDPALAAFLRTRRYPLIGVRPTPRGPEFHFEDRPGRAEDVAAYISGESVLMSPRDFARTIKAMRSAAATQPMSR